MPHSSPLGQAEFRNQTSKMTTELSGPLDVSRATLLDQRLGGLVAGQTAQCDVLDRFTGAVSAVATAAEVDDIAVLFADDDTPHRLINLRNPTLTLSVNDPSKSLPDGLGSDTLRIVLQSGKCRLGHTVTRSFTYDDKLNNVSIVEHKNDRMNDSSDTTSRTLVTDPVDVRARIKRSPDPDSSRLRLVTSILTERLGVQPHGQLRNTANQIGPIALSSVTPKSHFPKLAVTFLDSIETGDYPPDDICVALLGKERRGAGNTWSNLVDKIVTKGQRSGDEMLLAQLRSAKAEADNEYHEGLATLNEQLKRRRGYLLN